MQRQIRSSKLLAALSLLLAAVSVSVLASCTSTEEEQPVDEYSEAEEEIIDDAL